jgi:GH15 family glucan-1,4-alpha-glucosidase
MPLLVIPLVGFLPASDERIRSTIEVIQKELVMDGFVFRYRPDDSAQTDRLRRAKYRFRFVRFG